MRKRVALGVGLVLILSLALIVFGVSITLGLAGAELPILSYSGSLAFVVIAVFTGLTVFPLQRTSYLGRFINRLAPLPSEKPEMQGNQG